MMSSADFVAAQARLQARRQQREAAERARLAAEHEYRTASLARLPSPLNRLGTAGMNMWDMIIQDKENARLNKDFGVLCSKHNSKVACVGEAHRTVLVRGRLSFHFNNSY